MEQEKVLVDKNIISGWLALLTSLTYSKSISWESNETFDQTKPSPFHRINEWYRCEPLPNYFIYLRTFPDRDVYEVTVVHNSNDPETVISDIDKEHLSEVKKLYKSISVTSTGNRVTYDTFLGMKMLLEKNGYPVVQLNGKQKENPNQNE